jgi:ribonucleoside-diphosphate reductase alpha chain
MSVAVNDKFMEAVEADEMWSLWFPDIHHPLYDEEWAGDFEAWEAKGYPKVIYKTLPAREIWELLLRNTYNRNEPGIYFIDNANRFNNLIYYQKITGTNPCGEISMLADAGVVEIQGVLYEHLGDICNLGTINLVSYWDGVSFDTNTFIADIHFLVRALDNLIDISAYPLEGLKTAARLRRKIGCGLMGYGSLMMMMGMRYGSPEANAFATSLMSIYANEAYTASALIASKKGTFLLYDETKIFDGGFIKNSGVLTPDTIDLIKAYGIRNSQMLTAAPNGNTGVLMGIVSGGVEPVYQKDFVRWVTVSHKVDAELGDNPYPRFDKQEWHETDYFKFSLRGDEEVLVSVDGKFMIDKNRGLTKSVDCRDFGWAWCLANMSPEKIAYLEEKGVFATSMELTIEDHIEPFIIFSKAIDNSISKTINIANDAPFEDFDRLYKRLWKEGVRGCTTYRDGTMTAVLESKNTKATIEKAQDDFYAIWEGHNSEHVFGDVTLPDTYPLMGHIIKSEGKKFYLNVAFKDRGQTKPFAIFVSTNNKESDILTYTVLDVLESLAKELGIPDEHIDRNKSKYSGQNNINKLARTVSLMLRHNVPIELVVETLDSVQEIPISSFIFRLKKFLCKFIPNKELVARCPECGAPLMYNEGCKGCTECAFTFCG